MNHDFQATTNFLSDNGPGSLTSYLQAMQPEVVAQLSKPQSQEVIKVMEQNISGMLGNLPSDTFNIMVSTSKENLGRLLASAMVGGYFIRNAELRYAFEKSLPASSPDVYVPEASSEPEA